MRTKANSSHIYLNNIGYFGSNIILPYTLILRPDLKDKGKRIICAAFCNQIGDIMCDQYDNEFKKGQRIFITGFKMCFQIEQYNNKTQFLNNA